MLPSSSQGKLVHMSFIAIFNTFFVTTASKNNPYITLLPFYVKKKKKVKAPSFISLKWLMRWESCGPGMQLVFQFANWTEFDWLYQQKLTRHLWCPFIWTSHAIWMGIKRTIRMMDSFPIALEGSTSLCLSLPSTFTVLVCRILKDTGTHSYYRLFLWTLWV